MTDWSIEPMFGSYLVVIAIILGMFATLFLIRETGSVGRWKSALLWTLRLVICLLLCLILLKPGITYTKQATPRGTIAVMMDSSASMQLPSGEGVATRWDTVRSIWKQLWNSKDAFGKDASFAAFTFDSTLKPIHAGKADEVEVRDIDLPKNADGISTDIGGPFAQLLAYPFDSPLAAVIWMGDGSQTHTPSGGDPQQFARRLAQIDVPIYVVGIGPRSDSDNAPDIAIEELPEQLDVFTKNPVNIRGVLNCRGVANRELIIKLWMLQPGIAPKEVSLDRLQPTKSEQTLPFRLPLVAPGEAGAYELAVRVEPVKGEAVSENNEATVYLNVRGGGARILYIEGEPRHEMTFLQRAISENADMQLAMHEIRKSKLERWPVDLSQQLNDGAYDCIILGDVDYKAIESANARTIAEQVKKGTGLVTLGGYFAYGPGGWERTPIDEVLPIDLSGMRRQEQNRPIELQNHIPGPIKMVPVGSSELLQIDAPERNAETWGQLKPLLGANKWTGLKKAPGIVVHAETSEKQPLVVSGMVDKGRVVSIAVDSTYLWWRQGRSAEHKAFWRKILYWCLRREATEEGMQLSMPKRRLLLQQSSELVIQWNGGSEQTEMPKEIQLHLWKLPNALNATGNEQDLGVVPTMRRDAKSMRANFSGLKEAGRYEWRATAMSKGNQIESKLPFVIADSSVETTRPMPDWQLLNQIARLNASAGGTLVAPEQTDDIVEQILERRKQSTQTSIESRRLGEGTLDSWGAFCLIALALIAQWALRKRWNLP